MFESLENGAICGASLMKKAMGEHAYFNEPVEHLNEKYAITELNRATLP